MPNYSNTLHLSKMRFTDYFKKVALLYKFTMIETKILC